MSISDILVKRAVFQRDSHDRRKPQIDPAIGGILVHEVDLYILNRGAPAVEAEYFVGKIDHLLCREVVYFAASIARSRRDVLRSKLFVQSALKRGDFLSGVLADLCFLLDERVGGSGRVAVLIAWTVNLSARCDAYDM